MNEDTPKIGFEAAFFLLLTLVLIVVIFDQLASIIQPFFLAVFICYLGVPLHSRLHRWKLPRLIAHAAIPLIVILILILFSWIVTTGLRTLDEKMPGYQEQLMIGLNTFLNLLQHSPFLQKYLGNIQDPVNQISSSIDANISFILNSALKFGKSFFSFFVTILVVGFYIIFILLEVKSLPERVMRAYGEKKGGSILQLIAKINQGIVTYIRIKTFTSLLVATLCSVIMFLFGVDLWLFWGLMIFVGNFIPYIGSIFAVIPPVLIFFLQTGSFLKTFLLLIFLVIAQNLVGTFLEPRLAGKALNLSPLLVILSLAFWGWLWGIVGMFLSVPILVAIKAILEHIPPTRSFALFMEDV